YLEPGPVTV
nr:Chain C, TYR-LEU-GLU-PRO-GLY-PRO-VAL-THR-VAL [synthetic construct]7PHR_P Chain P, Tumor-associated antigentic peptide gp100 [Homo sapiens]